jgi:hypothetical protein
MTFMERLLAVAPLLIYALLSSFFLYTIQVRFSKEFEEQNFWIKKVDRNEQTH